MTAAGAGARCTGLGALEGGRRTAARILEGRCTVAGTAEVHCTAAGTAVGAALGRCTTVVEVVVAVAQEAD